MTRSQIRKYAFIKSIPIMCSYIFVSMAYGIMMEEAGFKWYYSLLVSLTVYDGSVCYYLYRPVGENRPAYTGSCRSGDRYYLSYYIWGFRLYASCTIVNIRTVGGVAEEKGGSINEYRKNMDRDRSFGSLYLFPACASVSGF